MSDKQVKVMVVDDSTTIRKSAAMFLSKTGYEIVLVENGYDALASICENRPDIIFLDISMPKLDGYQTCQVIKQNPDYQNIPIIMLSSKDGLFDKAKGLAAGSNEYITKPFSKDILINTVKKHTES